MNYITSQEAAEKWGLTRRSVQLYCQSGRISGAINPGKQWLIPEDAERPPDTRLAENKQPQDVDGYHFPVFVYTKHFVSPSELSEDERLLREAQILNLKSEFSESVTICRGLIAKSASPSVQFGAWFTNYANFMLLGLASQLPACLTAMEQIFAGVKAHKEEYRLLFAFLDYFYRFDRTRYLTIDVSKLGRDAITTYEIMSIAIAFFSVEDIPEATIRFFEGACRETELVGIAPASLTMHGTIAMLYSRRRNMDAKLRHIDKACRIGFDNGITRLLSRCSGWDIDTFSRSFSKIDKKFASAVRDGCIRNRNNWVLAYKLHSGPAPTLDLNFFELEIVLLLVYKTPMADIAMLKNITVKEVRETLKAVCARLGLKSKKELVDSFKATFFSAPDTVPAMGMPVMEENAAPAAEPEIASSGY